MSWRRVYVAAFPLILSSVYPSSLAETPTANSGKTPGALPPLISLSSLGYRDGIDFSGFEGRRDLFFRVPSGAWLKGVHLLLPYEAQAAGPGRRTLTVSGGNHILSQTPLGGDGVADVAIPPDAIVDGTVHVTVAYSGGETPNRCFDRRIGGDHLHLDPRGGLAFDLVPGTPLPVGAAAALLSHDPKIALPAAPTPEQAAAALSVAAARGYGGLAQDGAAQIGGPRDPALRTVSVNGTPGLAFGGPDPAGAARAAFSGLGDLLTAPAVQRVALQPRRTDRLTFADLGADPRAISIADQGGWVLALPASRLPAGKTVRGLDIAVAAVPDGAARPASVSAWMNGTLLGSAPLEVAGPTRLRVNVPDGIVHTLNGIEVRIDRQDHADCGDVPRGWPAQLLGSSEVVLGSAGPVHDFHDFAAAAGQGVTVVMPDARALPYAAVAVAGLFSADTPIRVSYGTIPADGPVLLIGDQAPAGTLPSLKQANGRLVLAAKSGSADIDLPDGGDLTVAQLVEADGRPILWIRPSTQGRVPQSMWLDQGDIAITAADGAITPLSSQRQQLAAMIPLPDDSGWHWFDGKWLLLLVGALIAISVVIWSFRPSVKRAKPGQDV